MTRKSILFASAVLFPLLSLAQKNVFHERSYWKSKPTVATVQAEMTKGSNASESNSNGFDATVFAILEGAPKETIDFLLSQKGNDVNKITHDGRTYIFWAAYAGNTELMKDLIKRGAKTDIIEDHGYTILNFAAANGQKNTAVYDICLANGADLRKDVDHDGANALLLVAPYATDFKLLDYFSKKGLDIDGADANGNSAFTYASKTGNVEYLRALIKKGVPYNDSSFLFAAAGTRGTSNTIETYQFLKSLNLKPGATNKNGDNALHILARKEGQLEIIKWFIDNGADANQVNKDGNTPLMNASGSGEVTTVTTLLARSKDINLANNKGMTALTFAVERGTPQVIELLLSKGANANVTDKDGDNLAAHLIQSYNGRTAASFDAKVKILEKAGVNFATPQKNGNTFYHLSVAKNDLDLIKRAAAYKVDVNAKNKEGYTALHKAAMLAKNDEILKYLTGVGAKKDVKTEMDETAFDLASENESLSKNKISIEFLKKA